MDLGILVFVVAGAVFLTMTILTFLIVMPQLKTRSNLKQRIAIASGKMGDVKLARGDAAKAAAKNGISNHA